MRKHFQEKRVLRNIYRKDGGEGRRSTRENTVCVTVISSDPPCKNDNTRFTITTASLTGLSDKL